MGVGIGDRIRCEKAVMGNLDLDDALAQRREERISDDRDQISGYPGAASLGLGLRGVSGWNRWRRVASMARIEGPQRRRGIRTITKADPPSPSAWRPRPVQRRSRGSEGRSRAKTRRSAEAKRIAKA